MTNDEHWQQIEDLLKVEKKRRTKRHGEELRAHVAALLAAANGRESIRSRFSSKSGFSGKEWFVRELLRTVEQMQEKFSEIPVRERSDLLREILRQSRPKVDQPHWDTLWLLHREGQVGIGQEVVNSLDKVAPKKDDLVRTLSGLQAWQSFPSERAAALLEAAKKSATSADAAARIDQALQWVSSRLCGVTVKPTDGELVQTASPLAIPFSTVDQTASARDGGLATCSAGETVASRPVQRQVDIDSPKIEKIGQQPAGSPTPIKETPAPVEAMDVPSCVAQVSRLVESLFRRQAERVIELEQEATATRFEVAGLRDQLTIAQEKLESLQGSLQRETDIAQELRHEKVRLEGYLADRERDLAAVRSEVQKVTHQLAEMRQEIEATRRRADDYVHYAERERDSAVRTFQASLWETLQNYLIEILQGPTEESSLSADQQFFRQRLREIKDALRDAGVPPF
jgi:DNA repair exonuclease SbcCD ATPase subunit